MIKRTNPDNKNKKELAIELLKIKERQISKLESNLKHIKRIKDKLIDLKIEINQKEGLFSQLKLRFKIIILADELIDYGLNEKFLKQIRTDSIKDLKSESKSAKIEESNEKLIKNILTEINKYIIETEKVVKNFKKDGKLKYKKTIKQFS